MCGNWAQCHISRAHVRKQSPASQGDQEVDKGVTASQMGSRARRGTKAVWEEPRRHRPVHVEPRAVAPSRGAPAEGLRWHLGKKAGPWGGSWGGFVVVGAWEAVVVAGERVGSRVPAGLLCGVAGQQVRANRGGRLPR